MEIKWFEFGIVSFAIGIGLKSFFDLHYAFPLFSILLAVTIFLGFQLSPKKGLSKLLLFPVFLLAIGFGMLRFDLSDRNNGDYILNSLVGRSIEVEAIISNDPDIRENTARIEISFRSLILSGDKKDISSKALLIVDRHEDIAYGDILKIRGILKKPENFETDDGNQFDYISYLAKDGIFYEMFKPDFEIIERRQGNLIKSRLFEIKRAFLSSLQRILPAPESSLAGGLLIGDKRSLSPDSMENFRKAGVVHIVVLSGYNITLVSDFIGKILSFLPPIFGYIGSGISIIIFTILTGASATAIRASIMAVLVILAKFIGRKYDMKRALLIAGFFMLIQNPKILMFDPSFQLSFLATLALIILAPHFERLFYFLPKKLEIRKIASATLSTQIFVLPILLSINPEFSLVSLPANLLTLILVPSAMLFSFVAGLIGIFSTFIASPFSFLAFLPLKFINETAEFFGNLQFATLPISPSVFPFVVGLYVLAGFVFWFWKKVKY